MTIYREYINKYKNEFLKDLRSLIKIPSVSDETKAKDGSPFGDYVKSCFDEFEAIAIKLGFEIEKDNGYAICAYTIKGDDYIGILGHLDVVDAGSKKLWDYNPYDLTIQNGILYGRGVNDDKGPLLGNLYALKILEDMGYEFKMPVKIIAGGAEETTWHCMDHYFKYHKQPIMGYSPDGNFPIVNGEKGILTYLVKYPLKKNSSVKVINIIANQDGYIIPDEITVKLENYIKDKISFKGKKALTRNPQKAINPIFELSNFVLNNKKLFDSGIVLALNDVKSLFSDPFGKDIGIYYEDEEMGKTSIALFNLNINDEYISYSIDVRYPKGIDKEVIYKNIIERISGELSLIREKKLLYVDKNSTLINKLSDAYENIMHEKAECFTKGGASYARVLDNGIAFGATFDGYDTRPHMPNENMREEDLYKAIEIYCEAIRLLACK